jgi:predicted GH43/DUF377 family glycosyl hydrolase
VWCFLLVRAALWAAPIDLEEEMLSDFVLETKKIDIPCFPDAFNPSIIRWKGAFLMSFRTGGCQQASGDESFLMSFRIRDPLTASTNQIGLIFLNAQFEPVSAPQILNVAYDNPAFAFRQQDPRLLTIKDRIYMVYSNMIEGAGVPEIRRMFVVELYFDGRTFFAGRPVCLSQFEGESEQRWQKNWVPFHYEDTLLLAYSLTPHRIFLPHLGTGECATVASTRGDVEWAWGVLRGGTPALLDGGEYLAFFHSSIDMPSVQSEGKEMTHYFMGAYTFSAHPPFALTRVSARPIVGKNFYNGPAHTTWKPLRVVFPCGFISDEERVWVVYGRQDHEVWVATFDKKRLLESLKPVAAAE